MTERPTGTVTFLFTDIEGSTPIAHSHAQIWPATQARHHEILRVAVTSYDGFLFQIVGDGCCVAFAEPQYAIQAAVAAQQALQAEPWDTPPIRVRMGIHTGAAEAREGDYQGYLTLARVQRVMSAGHGGQMLISQATADLVRGHLPAGTNLRELGSYRLRGLAQPEQIFQVVAAGLRGDFPPLRGAEPAHSPTAQVQGLAIGQLVGRARELDQLRAHWSQALNGQGGLVLLSGEPGVGKTRLANELMVLAEQQGALVLRGGCYEYEAATPYLPFVEALRTFVRAQHPEHLRAQLGATAPELAKLAPEIETKLGALPPNPTLPANEERLRLYDHVARFLRSVASTRGLLLFIDDLHWADHSTLALLQYLLRDLRHDRFLALATYREVELARTHPLAGALVEWNRERLATRLALARLSRDETAALLAGLFAQAQVSPDFASAIYNETEGNPYFVEEVLKALIEQGQVYREAGGWNRRQVAELTVPQSIKEAIGRRLSRLSPPCAELLHTAALLGKVFAFDDLAAVAATGEDALLNALDEATAAQLIKPQAGDSFIFTHDKIRETLHEELSPIRRRRLHHRIGEALEKQSARQVDEHAPDLAYHFVESGDWQRGLTYSLQAAERAARLFAHDEALAYYERARECADMLNEPAQVAKIHRAVGDVRARQGEFQLAVNAYQRALTPDLPPAQRASLQAIIGRTYADTGDERGVPFLDDALRDLNPETQPLEAALALAALGRFHHYHARHTQAIEFFERARTLAEPFDDAPTVTNIYGWLAGACEHMTQYDSALRWAERCVAFGERKHYLPAVALGTEYLAEIHVQRGNWREGIATAARDRAVAEQIGDQQRLVWADYLQGYCLYGQGNLTGARALTESVVERTERIGELRLAGFVRAILSMILVDLGDDEGARVNAETARLRSDETSQPFSQNWVRVALIYWYVRQADWARAIQLSEECDALLAGSENRMGPMLRLSISAQAYLGAGRLDDALRTAETLQSIARPAQAPQHEAEAQHVVAQIRAAQHAWAGAEQAYAHAIVTFEQLGSRLALGRALGQRASLYQTITKLDAARADLARAHALFVECHALRDLNEVKTQLAALNDSVGNTG